MIARTSARPSKHSVRPARPMCSLSTAHPRTRGSTVRCLSTTQHVAAYQHSAACQRNSRGLGNGSPGHEVAGG
eukprot:3041261-Rhodomonas_salina.1